MHEKGSIKPLIILLTHYCKQVTLIYSFFFLDIYFTDAYRFRIIKNVRSLYIYTYLPCTLSWELSRKIFEPFFNICFIKCMLTTVVPWMNKDYNMDEYFQTHVYCRYTVVKTESPLSFETQCFSIFFHNTPPSNCGKYFHVKDTKH